MEIRVEPAIHHSALVAQSQHPHVSRWGSRVKPKSI